VMLVVADELHQPVHMIGLVEIPQVPGSGAGRPYSQPRAKSRGSVDGADAVDCMT
jgi:hypothetical protein